MYHRLKFILFSFVFIIIIGNVKLENVHAQGTNTSVVDATLHGLLNLLINPCNVTRETANAKSKYLNEKYGLDKGSTAGYQFIANGCSRYLKKNPSTAEEYLNGSAIGKVLSYSAMLYNEKPASGLLWFQQQYYAITGKGDVYAQNPNDTEYYSPGTGYSLLQPFQGLWIWSRNLAYTAFIVLIIVVGFMILFRNNLGGETPITIFNSIPTMILSLILITFSYAISGLFIDVITVGTTLSQNILVSGINSPGNAFIWNGSWTPQRPIEGAPSLVDKKMIQPDDPQVSVWQIFNTANPTRCDNTGDCSFSTLIPGNTGPNTAAAGVAKGVLDLLNNTGLDVSLLNLVMGFAIFTASVKIFLALLSKYIQLTIGVIISPWYFFLAAIPSKTHSSIVDFLKVNLGSALTFIIIYFVFIFLIVFAQSPATTQLTWVPPLLGYTNTGIEKINLIKGIITMGIMLALPSLPPLIDKFLDVPEANEIVSGAGSHFTSAAKGVKGYALNIGKLAGIHNPLTSGQ